MMTDTPAKVGKTIERKFDWGMVKICWIIQMADDQVAVDEIDNQQRSTQLIDVPERTGTIYLLTFPNGKKYVGQTIQKFENRLAKHKWCSTKGGGCPALSAAIRAHGWDNVTKEVIWTGPADQLNAKEIELIAHHNVMAPNGYNLHEGGDNAISRETLTKMRESALNRDWTKYKRSEETRGLPKYVIKIPGGYKIAKHPRCPHMTFRSTPDDEFNRMDAISHLRMIDEDPTMIVVPRVHPKITSVRSVGAICESRNGYRFSVTDMNGKQHTIESSGKKLTKEENHARISARLAEFKQLMSDTSRD